jgi:hypothetical protein
LLLHTDVIQDASGDAWKPPREWAGYCRLWSVFPQLEVMEDWLEERDDGDGGVGFLVSGDGGVLMHLARHGAGLDLRLSDLALPGPVWGVDDGGDGGCTTVSMHQTVR